MSNTTSINECPKSPLLNRKEAAKYLDISVQTLDRLVKEGTIIPVRLRRFVRFKKEDLDNPVQKQKNSSQSNIN